MVNKMPTKTFTKEFYIEDKKASEQFIEDLNDPNFGVKFEEVNKMKIETKFEIGDKVYTVFEGSIRNTLVDRVFIEVVRVLEDTLTHIEYSVRCGDIFTPELKFKECELFRSERALIEHLLEKSGSTYSTTDKDYKVKFATKEQAKESFDRVTKQYADVIKQLADR